MKKMQLVRAVSQLVFFILISIGLHETVHPALFFLFPLAFVAGNFFCGWVCPFGAAQEYLGRAGSIFIKKKLTLPRHLQRYAQYLRYTLLLILLSLIGLGIMSAETLETMPLNAYRSFTGFFDGYRLGALSLVFLVFLLLLSLVSDRPFCNYLCFEAIEYALPSWTRLLTIKRKPCTCVRCGLCDKACPMHIQVSQTEEVLNLQCINCFKCLSSCPVEDTLSYGKADRRIERIKSAAARLRKR